MEDCYNFKLFVGSIVEMLIISTDVISFTLVQHRM